MPGSPRGPNASASLLALGLVCLFQGCVSEPVPPFFSGGATYSLVLFDDSKEVATGTLRVSPDDPARGEFRLRLLSGDSELGRLLRAKTRDGTCDVGLAQEGGVAHLHLLPHVEDNTVHLSGRISGSVVTGTVGHAAQAGVKVLGRFTIRPN